MDDDIARAQLARKGSPFLTTEQAAEYVGLTTHQKKLALGNPDVIRGIRL